MKNIADAHFVLKLNKLWQEIGVASVGKSLVDLVTGVVEAMNIDWELDDEGVPVEGKKPIYVEPVTWDRWVNLPVRPYDISIRSTKMEIRVPMVVIAHGYDKMPKTNPKKVPNNQSVQHRDGGRCQYTGKLLSPGEGNVDHVIPLGRGGRNTWDNVVWSERNLNLVKGDKLNKEAGLKLIRPIQKPKPIEAWEKIKRPKHRDWVPFMRKFSSRLQ